MTRLADYLSRLGGSSDPSRFFSGRSQPRSIFSCFFPSSFPAVVPYPFLYCTHEHRYRYTHCRWLGQRPAITLTNKKKKKPPHSRHTDSGTVISHCTSRGRAKLTVHSTKNVFPSSLAAWGSLTILQRTHFFWLFYLLFFSLLPSWLVSHERVVKWKKSIVQMLNVSSTIHRVRKSAMSFCIAIPAGLKARGHLIHQRDEQCWPKVIIK